MLVRILTGFGLASVFVCFSLVPPVAYATQFITLPATRLMLQLAVPTSDRTPEQIGGPPPGKSSKREATRRRRISDKQRAGLDGKLVPHAQKEMRKALEALRTNNLSAARSHLDTAYRLAPQNAEVNYMFGVYSSQSGNLDQARTYWTKTVEFDPQHLSALLSLSELLLRQKKTAEAVPLLRQAEQAEPSSWRSHALLSEALLLQGSRDEAIRQAERALELGHGTATAIQPLLAKALAESGDTTRAVTILQSFLKEHPADAAVQRQLSTLQASQVSVRSNGAAIAPNQLEALAITSALTAAVISLPLPSSWLPPDVDERVPPVEPDVPCALDDVLQKVAQRMQEFVTNVDRFTATESLKHESINNLGFASSLQRRKFDYVVSIQELAPGHLSVEEYRSSRGADSDFPDGVATIGLPALVLIFHPANAGAFEMSCEGLARFNGTLGWQVHFRQRNDRPNTVRNYRIGVNGPSYPVALRGRAWISADTYQILRLETDLIAPVPEIRLSTDRAIIEYGPVHFREGRVDMWLPQSAELYYDWKGRRSHRRHDFSNYLLFSVGDKQRISAPKIDDEPPSSSSANATKRNP